MTRGWNHRAPELQNLRERRTDALAYLPIPRINPVAQGFIPAKDRKPEDGGRRAKDRDLNIGRQGSIIEDIWKLVIRYWILDIRLLPF